MSLDDECPTQYFGPDAEVWVSPDGRTVQLSPAEANRYRDSFAQVGWRKSAAKPLVFGDFTVNWTHPDGTTHALTPGQKDAIDKTEALFNVAGEHRNGCALKRTGRCTCAYQSQWDHQRNEAGTEDWPVPYIPEPSMTAEEAESLFKHPGTLIPHLERKLITVDEKKYKEDAWAWGGLVDQRNMWESRAKSWKAATIGTVIFAVAAAILAVGGASGWW